MAACEAASAGARVAAIDKGIIGNDCSAVGAKQIAGSGYWSKDKDDSPEIHLQDTLKSGCYLNDEDLTRIFTKKIEPAILRLEELGMPFTRTEDGSAPDVSGNAPGHSRQRSLRCSDITGKMLVDTMLEECRRAEVTLLSEHAAVDLVNNGQGICGAIVLDAVHSELKLIRAKAVVICTGGLGRLYELTSNPVQITGDGIALALRAGARVMDMEFVQFYPVTVIAPASLRGMNLNSQYYGAQLFNSKGERFMAKYFPEQMERTTRDKLARSIAREIAEGNGSPNGGVYIDASMLTEELYRKKIPTEWKVASKAGVNLVQQRLEIAPAAHYYMGGICIDKTGRSTVPGLFAAGECCSGIQGANRLANNGLAEAVAFGYIVGGSAAAYAASAQLPACPPEDVDGKVRQVEACFGEDGVTAREYGNSIRRIVTRDIGVLREEAGLRRAAEELEDLRGAKLRVRRDLPWNPELMEALTARNMLTVARTIACAALMRTESRGAHYRTDCPDIDDENWLANIVATMDAQGEITASKQGVGTGGERTW